jgi:ribonuclease-3
MPALDAVTDKDPALTALQTRLDHRFRDPALLALAVTHPSWLADHPGELESNQRLEFLGDAVLLLILSDELFRLFPHDREGPLSRRRAALLNGSFLAGLARQLGLDACLRFGAGEERAGGRARPAALEDAFEALVGALYLDAGLDTARRVVLVIYGDIAAQLAAVEDAENPKGRLQELVQPRHGNDALRYEVVRTGGTAHAREYEVAVLLLDKRLGSGRGSSKKIAEEAAAAAALAAWPPTDVPTWVPAK